MRIQPPTAGVNRVFGFQSQAPYTTPSATNVWPIDSLAQRLRFGSRYGVSKAIASRPASNPTIALMGFRNFAATSLNLLAINGLTTGNPIAAKYASGAWSTATATEPIPATGGKRIVLASVPAVGGTGTYSATTVGDVAIACAGFGNKILFYDEADHATKLLASGPAISTMLHGGNLWFIKAPRHWDNGIADGDLDVGGSVVSNDLLTGCVPWTSDYALFFTSNSTTLLYGDPTRNGFRSISNRLGMIDPLAWCRGTQSQLFVMSKAGLLLFATPGFDEPEIMSHESVPASLKGIDPLVYHVSLAYDTTLRGVLISISKITSAAGVEHWFYKLPEGEQQPGGYWPLGFHVDVEPFSYCTYGEPPSGVTASTNTDLLWGGRNGYIYQFDPASATDDGNTITSTLWQGPFYGYDPEWEGIVQTIVATLAASGGSVDWSIHISNSAESAFSSTAMASGTWTAGTNLCERPEVGGYAWFLKLTSTARWGIENIIATRKKTRRFRG